MSNKKIECPKWLKDPSKYDVAKSFQLQDWYEQIYQRHCLSNQIRVNEQHKLLGVLEDPLNQPSGASINGLFDIMKRKPHIYSSLDSVNLGLSYSNVWSQTIDNVEKRSKINKVVREKYDFITEEFPNKICEQLANEDKDFFGIASLNVDLFADKEDILHQFTKWLKSAKKFHEYDQYDALKFNNWAHHRSLAYWDLVLWIKAKGYTYNKTDSQIPKSVMQEWIRGDAMDKNQYNKVNLINASEKYYKKMKTWQMLEVLKSRLDKPESISKRSAIKTHIKTPVDSTCNSTVSKYLKDKGYNP